jgi:hypothetical protein
VGTKTPSQGGLLIDVPGLWRLKQSLRTQNLILSILFPRVVNLIRLQRIDDTRDDDCQREREFTDVRRDERPGGFTFTQN